jgi:hypothetical protein
MREEERGGLSATARPIQIYYKKLRPVSSEKRNFWFVR